MQANLIKILLYFDVFSYPLTRQELLQLAGIPGREIQAADCLLEELVDSGLINYSRGYYFVGNRKSLIGRRIAGNRRAKKRMKAARRYSRIISWFPFVRGVFLSGSISKNFMTRHDDIDYFIITHPGRLWLTRSMLTIFKKVFLFNSYRNFCINYFVDTENLRISEQNRFTATEVVFLLPMYNRKLYDKFLHQNQWTAGFYPVFRQNPASILETTSWLKRFAEFMLDNSVGDRLERFLFKKSGKYIREKYRHMNNQTFYKCFSLKTNELRYLPNRQQHSILKRFCAKVKGFEKRTGIALGNEKMPISAETH
jgi:hypothetical protein